VAVILAASPLMIRLVVYLFAGGKSDGPPARAASPQVIERSEVRDELQRLTASLETDRRGVGRIKG
jgi:hypothetical protein